MKRKLNLDQTSLATTYQTWDCEGSESLDKSNNNCDFQIKRMKYNKR